MVAHRGRRSLRVFRRGHGLALAGRARWPARQDLRQQEQRPAARGHRLGSVQGRPDVRAGRLRAPERPAGDERGDADRGQSAAGDAPHLHGSGGSIRLDNALSGGPGLGLAPQRASTRFRNPRLQTWNVNVQRELGREPRRHGRLLRVQGRPPAHRRATVNQFMNGVRPYPRLSAGSPILPGSALGNITEIDEPRLFALQRRSGSSLNQRIVARPAVQRSYTWSKSKDTNSLNSPRRRRPGQLRTSPADYGYSDYDARHRYVLNAIWELPFKGNSLRGRLADLGHHPGADRQPDHRPHEHRNFTGVANTSGRTSSATSVVFGRAGPVVLDRVCDPRVAGSCTSSSVFALPVSRTACSTSATSPRNASRPGLLQHGLVAHQEDAESGSARWSSGPRRSTSSTTRTSASPAASPPSAAPASGSSRTRAFRPATPARRARSSSPRSCCSRSVSL